MSPRYTHSTPADSLAARNEDRRGRDGTSHWIGWNLVKLFDRVAIFERALLKKPARLLDCTDAGTAPPETRAT